uniref:Vps4_C domain-containing protein n=1 Tax=Panagrellus redivivus TaxID=6233 RepID=A0A7E4V3E7_PANRE
MMTGIAAILRYPLMELEDEDMDDNEKDYSNSLAARTSKLDIDEFIKNEFPALHTKLMERAIFYKNMGKGGYESEGNLEMEEEEEDDDETDTEQPPARPYMTLGDCIVGKR